MHTNRIQPDQLTHTSAKRQAAERKQEQSEPRSAVRRNLGQDTAERGGAV